MEFLPIELGELKAADYHLELLGFDADELAKIFNGDVTEGQCDPDDVPAAPDAAITQPGDLWILGDHRLLCGDSSKPEDLDRLLDGAIIHLVNTDPPYNVKVEPRSNNAIAAGLSSFPGTTPHQGLDLARHPGKSKPTQKKLRAEDRPLTCSWKTIPRCAFRSGPWMALPIGAMVSCIRGSEPTSPGRPRRLCCQQSQAALPPGRLSRSPGSPAASAA
jgi:hypothetical protein